MEKTKICVVGMGYIGLPLAIFLAEKNYPVLGVDIDQDKITKLKDHKLTIIEDDLEGHFNKAVKNGCLIFDSSIVPSDVYIIAVPTPINREMNVADLSYVKKALTSIFPYLNKGNLVIIESTVPPFTCRNIVKGMIEKETKFSVPDDILVAHCPERAYPGNLVKEFVYNDRIVGGMNPESTEQAYEIYQSFSRGEIFKTDDVKAEFIKLAENTYRDINIAFANELKQICDLYDIKVSEIIEYANKHPRVNILGPGIGVGGHCIPIDPWFLYQIAPTTSRLIPTARSINDAMPLYTAQKIVNLVSSTVNSPKVILIGKTYKPNVSDIRESPATKIIDYIRNNNYKIDITVLDPLLDNGSLQDIKSCARGSDLIVVLVPHKIVLDYIEKEKSRILEVMRTPKIVYSTDL